MMEFGKKLKSWAVK